MRSSWTGRAGVLVGVAVGLAAGGIAYAAVPGSHGVARSPVGSNRNLLIGSTGSFAITPHSGTRVGFASAYNEEAPVSMPDTGTLNHLHVALDRNVTSSDVQVSIYVNAVATGIGCTIGPGAHRCSDKTHSAGYGEGDLVDAWVTNNSGTNVYATWALRAG